MIAQGEPISTKRLQAIAQATTDATQGEAWLYAEAAQLARAHLKRVFDGANAWDRYSSEPKYRAYKLAVVGHDKPGRWIAGQERLSLSYYDVSSPWHLMRIDAEGLSMGSKLPYARDFEQGGVNQFGERYPARPITTADPVLTQWQLRIAQLHKQRVNLRVAER